MTAAGIEQRPYVLGSDLRRFWSLTWMLAAPCVLRVAVQLPVYLAGKSAEDAGPMVAALAVSKIAMGWPLQVAALAGMAWLLARNATPVQPERVEPA